MLNAAVNPEFRNEQAIEKFLAAEGFLNRNGMTYASIEDKGQNALAALLRGPKRHTQGVNIAVTPQNGVSNKGNKSLVALTH